MKKLCRLLFSRYAISAFMIVADILFIIYLFLEASKVYYAVFFAALILDICILVAIVNANVNPEYKVSWITVVMLFPFLGCLLFLLFYGRRMTKKEIRLGKQILEKLNTGDRNYEKFSELGEEDCSAAGRAMAIMRDDPIAAVYSASDTKYYTDGEEMYRDILRDLRSAQKYIFLEYFIIDEGEMWSGIYDVLKEKVSLAVTVRVLYDDIGCMKTLPSSFDKRLRSEGIDCRRFGRVNPKLSTVHNNRDHRKICVIDGRVAYTGGINIADEYINKKMRFGHWKDGGVRIFGEAALGFVKLYLQNWQYNLGVCEDTERFLLPPSKEQWKSLHREYFIPFGSGPNPIYPRSVGKEVFLNIIDQAQRYVYITTPYLVIDFELTESLRNAAYRGVDVRIITPAIADKKIVKIMTKSAYPYLMAAGVKIYEYTPGFIHEKLVVSDDIYSVVGSLNFDYRSLAHHFECAVWMYSQRMAEMARDDFMDTVSKSKEMDSTASKLSFSEWTLKNIMRFLAPLL